MFLSAQTRFRNRPGSGGDETCARVSGFQLQVYTGMVVVRFKSDIILTVASGLWLMCVTTQSNFSTVSSTFDSLKPSTAVPGTMKRTKSRPS